MAKVRVVVVVYEPKEREIFIEVGEPGDRDEIFEALDEALGTEDYEILGQEEVN